MMGSEDFGRETPGGLPEKPVNMCGGDPVEDKVLRLLVRHKFLEVFSDWTVWTVKFEGLLPSYAVFSEKVKLDASWKKFDVFYSKGRGTYCVCLVFLFLVTDPHGQVVDQVRDGRQLPDLDIRRVKVLLDELADI